MNELDTWSDILKEAKKNHKRVSILVEGSYKPYTGYVETVNIFWVELRNEYSVEYLKNSEIKTVRIYD